jgi:hypothetical protein
MGLADIPWQEMSSHGCLRWLLFQRSMMRDERIGIGVKDVSTYPGSPVEENGHTGQACLRFSDFRETQNRGFPPPPFKGFTRLGTIIGKKNGLSRRKKAESCRLGGIGLDDVKIFKDRWVKIEVIHDHQALSQVIA